MEGNPLNIHNTKTSHIFAILIAGFLSVIFIIVTLIILPIYNIETQLLKPELYKRALVKQNIYSRFNTLAAEQLVQHMHHDWCQHPGDSRFRQKFPTHFSRGIPRSLKNLNQDDRDRIITGLVPAGWLQTQTERVIDQTFALLDAIDRDATIVVSLQEIKDRAGGDHGVQAFLQFIRAQPPCSPTDLAAWNETLNENLEICCPPEQVLNRLMPVIRQYVKNKAAEIPGEVDLIELFQENADSTKDLANGNSTKDPRVHFQQVQKYVQISPLLPLGLFFVIALFVKRSGKDLVNWGCGLVNIVGLTACLLSFGTWFMIWLIITGDAATYEPTYWSVNWVQAAVDLLKYLNRAFFQHIGLQALVILLSCVALRKILDLMRN